MGLARRIFVTLGLAAVCSASSTAQANEPPRLTVPADLARVTGETINFTVTARDVDSSTVTLSASDLPGGARFEVARGNPVTSELRFDTGPEDAGAHSLRFKAEDEQGARSEAEVIVLLAEPQGGPVLFPLGPRTAREGSLLTFTATAFHPRGAAVEIAAVDLPRGARFVGRTFEWTPDFDQAGPYTVGIEASDGSSGASAEVEIEVLNTNRAPVFAALPSIEAELGEDVELAVQAADPDPEDTVSLRMVALQGTRFSTKPGNPAVGTLAWAPPGPGRYALTFIATDDDPAPEKGTLSISATIGGGLPDQESGCGCRAEAKTAGAAPWSALSGILGLLLLSVGYRSATRRVGRRRSRALQGGCALDDRHAARPDPRRLQRS